MHDTLEHSAVTLPAVLVRFLMLAVLLLNTLKWYKIRHGQLRPMALRSAA